MRRFLTALAIGATLALTAGSPVLAQVAAEQGIQALIKGGLSKEDLESSKREVEAAAAREPQNNRWQFGKALLLQAQRENIAARELMATVVEREPERAEYQYWYGTTIFQAINDTGMLSKLSWARKGKAALERALELEPNHVLAHAGLVGFYSEAPGIAGGSVAKAEEHAKALLAIPEGRGEFRGHMALAGLASERKDWAEMDRQYTIAESSKGDGASPSTAMTVHALALLQQANEPAKALAIAERLAKDAKPDDLTPFYLLGESRRKLGDCKAAIEPFETVLALKPEAQNSRFAIASCYEKLGEGAKAATHYEEFARRFPKDPRASEATAAAKRLRKAG